MLLRKRSWGHRTFPHPSPQHKTLETKIGAGSGGERFETYVVEVVGLGLWSTSSGWRQKHGRPDDVESYIRIAPLKFFMTKNSTQALKCPLGYKASLETPEENLSYCYRPRECPP